MHSLRIKLSSKCFAHTFWLDHEVLIPIDGLHFSRISLSIGTRNKGVFWLLLDLFISHFGTAQLIFAYNFFQKSFPKRVCTSYMFTQCSLSTKIAAPWVQRPVCKLQLRGRTGPIPTTGVSRPVCMTVIVIHGLPRSAERFALEEFKSRSAAWEGNGWLPIDSRIFYRKSIKNMLMSYLDSLGCWWWFIFYYK